MIIDDDEELWGKTFFGLRVMNYPQACENFQRLDIESVLLAIPSADPSEKQKIIKNLLKQPVAVKTLPSVSELINGDISVTQFKNIDVEDLLGRKPIVANNDLMRKNLVESVVLVTGAGGSIGSELCNQIIDLKPKKLLALEVSEAALHELLQGLGTKSDCSETEIVPLIGSVQDRNFIASVLSAFDVNTVFHAAAYKHVPYMEKNVMVSIKNNAIGTKILAEEVVKAGVENFTLISTDKAVNPTSFMGASKRLAELICQSM